MAEARRPGRNFLFVPGPTNIPDRILRAMHIAMEDHRSSDFPKLTKPLYEGLKQVFKTEDGDVVILPSSGTGAWECALTNTCSPGDKMLAARFGQFSHLWIELARRHGLEVIVQEEEWGTGANPERIAEALRADKAHTIKGVMVVHNETATGVTSGVAAVRRAIGAARHPALLYVDGVSSIGSIDFRMDEWGVDLAITGSPMAPVPRSRRGGLKLCAKEPKWHSDTVTAIMAARVQRRRRDRPRLSPLQSCARRRTVAGDRQAVSHRAFGRFERADAARRHRRRRDGDARCRHRGRARLRRGGGAGRVPRRRDGDGNEKAARGERLAR